MAETVTEANPQQFDKWQEYWGNSSSYQIVPFASLEPFIESLGQERNDAVFPQILCVQV